MRPRIEITRNMGDIQTTVDFSESFGSDFLTFLSSLIPSGTRTEVDDILFNINGSFTLSDDTIVDFIAQVSGTDFTYDINGQPADGVITSIDLLYEGVQTAVISGLSIDVSDFPATGPPLDTVEFTDSFFLGQRINFQGGDGDDILAGTNRNDRINLRDGDDIADGRGGRDIIRGGDGDDDLTGGAGTDGLFGGQGNDILDGGRGLDIVVGGGGNDTIFGGRGTDFLLGRRGNDVMEGGRGRDFMEGGGGNDILRGGNGDDFLNGGRGTNTLTGGNGEDDFFFATVNNANTTITDFEVGVDQVVIKDESENIDSFESVLENAQDIGGNVVITTGEGQSLTLEDISLAQLSASDFDFDIF